MSANTKSQDLTLKGLIKMLKSCLFDQLDKRHVLFFLIYFSVISVLELAAYAGGSKFITVFASRIWLIGGVICLITLLIYFVNTIKMDVTVKNIISLAGMAIVLIYLFYLCGNVNYTDVSPDAAQQAAAGLHSFSVKDLNYTGKAFLGYPNRQYIVIAVPALLLGRSIFTLQLGFAIPFILGIMTMYSGIREWTYRKGVNGIYAVLAVYAVFAFRFTTEYYINFEQAILPISLTMIVIGLFLHLLCKPNALCIFSLAWLGGLCSNSYTPVMATLGLLLVSLALLAVAFLTVPARLPYQAENRKQVAAVIIAADASILLLFIATLLGERADRATALRDNIKIMPFIKTSICEFLTDKNAVFMGGMGLLVIIYLFAALTLRLKLYDFLLSLWVLGVFIASNLLVGYTAYTTSWIMQRALIVIPVLVTGMILACCDIVGRYQINLRKSTLIVIIIAFAFIGRSNFMQINQSFTYFNNIQPMKYMLKDLEETTKESNISHTDNFNFVLYTDNILMQNPADYFEFLYPNATVYIAANGMFPEGINLSKPTMIYGDKDIRNMTPSNDINIVNYKNKRYKTEGNWYKIKLLPK